MPSSTDSYQENYQTLKKIAETMREQQEPDIDQLIELINQATEAYKKCQARIEAVEKALGLEDNDE
jgi:exodeoxyribonuclease VII small subunit